jgi:hypothetical protein
MGRTRFSVQLAMSNSESREFRGWPTSLAGFATAIACAHATLNKSVDSVGEAQS